jgi:hypothetical protein
MRLLGTQIVQGRLGQLCPFAGGNTSFAPMPRAQAAILVLAHVVIRSSRRQQPAHLARLGDQRSAGSAPEGIDVGAKGMPVDSKGVATLIELGRKAHPMIC